LEHKAKGEEGFEGLRGVSEGQTLVAQWFNRLLRLS
jgi:hypothetical protein